MKNALMALAAGLCAMALAAPASAHVDVRIHAAPPPVYYAPAPVVVHPRYAGPPAYYVVEPDWRARRDQDWRYQQWLRHEEWRRRQWYREHWRHGHGHRHHHRHGWDGRY
jgi:hypothetical protein